MYVQVKRARDLDESCSSFLHIHSFLYLRGVQAWLTSPCFRLCAFSLGLCICPQARPLLVHRPLTPHPSIAKGCCVGRPPASGAVDNATRRKYLFFVQQGVRNDMSFFLQQLRCEKDCIKIGRTRPGMPVLAEPIYIKGLLDTKCYSSEQIKRCILCLCAGDAWHPARPTCTPYSPQGDHLVSQRRAYQSLSNSLEVPH